MDFLLDPYVVAVPDCITNSEHLSAYVKSLVDWVELKEISGHKFWFTSFLVLALGEKYPYPSVLKQRCQTIPITKEITLNLQTALRVIQRDFMEPPYLEDEIRCEQLDFELIDSFVLPPEIESRLSPTVALALKQSLVLLAVAGVHNKSELAQNILFATNPLPVPAGQIELDMNFLQEGDIWEQTNFVWTLIAHPHQLDEIEGLINFWHDTNRAMSWAFEQLRACGAINTEQFLPKPLVGRHFNQSILLFHPEKNPALLDSLFRNTNLALLCTGGYERYGSKHHELRIGPESTQPQQVRASDGATAWRVHLSGSNRLHYWLLPDGRAELVKVVIHEDYSMD